MEMESRKFATKAIRITPEAFVKAACYRDTLFLFLDKNHALILPFSAMTQGTAGELESFWSRHSSEPIRHIGKNNKQHANR